ncbi:MAG: DUF389 domain-containing protein [Pseudanabaenaceae cyanobacterium bins.68]|nr:DUF389 domain-containing protein [Pseudanabaenaceae cyanobacterium bins.68]
MRKFTTGLRDLKGWVKSLLYQYGARREHLLSLETIRAELLDESAFDLSYLILIIGSCLIASLGLLSNSAAVIIGAMIVAPLMSPIRGIAFGALEGDVILFRRGLFSLALGTIIAILLAWLVGLVSGIPSFGSEILARSKPNLLDLGIAIAAGGISGYAKVQPKISASLAGTAIAVALMPPVCVVGLGLSQGNGVLSFGALLLYLTNFLGIMLACMLAFLLAGYTPFTQAKRALSIAAVLTGVLLIPLGLSFFDLIRQSRLEVTVRQALLSGTVTFTRLELIGTETNWLASPPEIKLTVRSADPITPKQVLLLERFLEQKLGQPFILIFEVSDLREVRSVP